jgi:hypothetical protein
LIDALTHIDSEDLHLFKEKGFPCPQMHQTEDNSLFHQKFKKSKNQKRVLSLLRRNGQLTYQRIRARKEIHRRLTRFFLMHSIRWESVGKTIFMEPSMRQFYINLTATLPEELIYFSELKQDERSIAMNYDFAYQNVLYWYKAAFDIQLKNQSPGLGLLCHIGQDIDSQNFHTLDFTRGPEKWKMRFANQVAYTTNIVMSKSKLEIKKYRLKKLLKHIVLSRIKNKERIKYKLGLLKYAIQKYGWIALFIHMFKKWFEQHLTVREMMVFQKECGEQLSTNKKSTDFLEFIQGSYEHLFNIVDLLNPIDKVRHLKQIIKRLDNGDDVCLGYLDGKLVYFLWMAMQKEKVYLEEVDYELAIKKDTVYIYDGFTLPQKRGCGIHKKGLIYATHQAFTKNACKHAVAVVPIRNTSAIRGLEKSGFKKIRTIKKKNQ